MATMMKSLFQHWLGWESGFDRKDIGAPQFGAVGQKVEVSPENNTEDRDQVNEHRDPASPWVHGLL